MNQEITAEIQNIITAKRATLPKGGRKQYPVAKYQIAKLTELGIIDAMPAGFGYTDAETVIKAATSGKRYEGAMVNGDGSEWSVEATELFKLLNPAPVVEVPAAADDVTVVVRETDNGFTVSLVLSNGFETEETGNYTTRDAAYKAGVNWSHEDWSEYA